jgi:hypothetical protein
VNIRKELAAEKFETYQEKSFFENFSDAFLPWLSYLLTDAFKITSIETMNMTQGLNKLIWKV